MKKNKPLICLGHYFKIAHHWQSKAIPDSSVHLHTSGSTKVILIKRPSAFLKNTFFLGIIIRYILAVKYSHANTIHSFEMGTESICENANVA